MSRRTYALIVLALATVIFFAVNILAASLFRQARLDLTQTSLHTLSKGTVELLGSIEEPITLRFFFSERAATNYFSIKNYATRVRDMLEAFAARSKGKIRLEVIKPEPFSPEEDRASAIGLTGASTNSGDTIYFGLEGTNLADGRETIPYFSEDRAAFLEYDLAVLVDRLNRLKKPVVGLLSTLPLATGPGGPMAAAQGRSQPSLIYQQIQERYDVELLGTDVDRIPETITVLLVVQPTDLKPETLYAIDQFVLRGGRLVAFIDPLSELAAEYAQGDFQAKVSSTLDPLLGSWGVSMSGAQIVADRAAAQRVAVPGPSGGQRIIDYVAWLSLTKGEMNTADPVTAEIDQLNLATVGAIVPVEGRTTTVTPLVSSSKEAMFVPVDDIRFAPDPADLLRRFTPTGETYTLAARITGPVSTAFPGGPPPPTPPAEGEAAKPPAPPLPPPLAQSSGPINVILMADTDIFDDRFWVQVQEVMGQRVGVPTANNADFVLNAVDTLMGSTALIGLRGRQVAERRFDLVDGIRRNAEVRYLKEEEQLQQKLDETQRRLEALVQQGGEGSSASFVVTPEQRAEIQRFREEIASTRLALRGVERNLRKDIDALGLWLRVINIGLVPLLVAAAAVALFILNRRRRARRRAAPAGGGATS